MKRLAELRKSRNLSQKELARELNSTQNTLSNWETGKREPDFETISTLANYFHVTTDYLIGNSDVRTFSKKVKKIPVLGYVRAGIPIEAIEEILDYEEISEGMASQGEYFGLSVKGDSMEPRIQEGDVVIVRKQPDVESGEVAVVLVNGNDATVKKFVKHENGVSLIAYNPKYEPMFYTCQEVENKPVSIIGKVVELRGKF